MDPIASVILRFHCSVLVARPCSCSSSSLETLDFKFLLKPKYSNVPCVVEEGPSRLLTGGMLQEEDARSALFKVGGCEEVLEYRLFIKVDIVSPFDLAASWRAYQENLEPSRVRGIPDVSINVAPDNMGSEVLPELTSSSLMPFKKAI